MRRLRWLLLLLLLLSLAGRLWHRPIALAGHAAPSAPHAVPTRPPEPALRFHRPAAAVSSTPTPTSTADPAATGGSPDAPAGEPEAPAVVTLEELPAEVRVDLFHLGMERLDELNAACGPLLTEPVALGAFATLDAAGLAELELRPIAPDGGPIRPLDELLPEVYADCVDDLLWSRDWSSATAGVDFGDAVLEIALTTRAE